MGRLKGQLSIIKLKNFDSDLPGTLFVRCYISAGSRRRIRIDSRELLSTNELRWDELILLECQGESNSIGGVLEKSSIVFELRWRRKKHILSLPMSSKLLGRAEVSWKEMLASAGTSMEKWISFVTTSHMPAGLKPPALLVQMEAQVVLEATQKRANKLRDWEECNCRDCMWNGDEEDIFALAATAFIDLLNGGKATVKVQEANQGNYLQDGDLYPTFRITREANPRVSTVETSVHEDYKN